MAHLKYKPVTLRGGALYYTQLSDWECIILMMNYQNLSISKLRHRLEKEKSSFKNDDHAVIRHLFIMLRRYKTSFDRKQFEILVEWASSLAPTRFDKTLKRKATNRRLNPHEYFEDNPAPWEEERFEAQAGWNVNHTISFPALTQFFESVSSSVPSNRKKTFEKIGINLGALFLCKSGEACKVALMNIVLEFVSVADVASALLKSVDFECLYQLFSRAGKFLSDTETFEAQSFDILDPMDSEMFKSLFRVLATFYAFLFDEKASSRPFLGLEWQKQLFTIYRNTNSMPEMLDFFIYFMKSTMEYVQIHVLGIIPDFNDTLKHLDSAYENWTNELFVLESIYLDREQGSIRQPQTRIRIINHYTTGQKLSQIVEAHKTISRGSYQHFIGLFAKSTKMAEHARAHSASDKFRVAPYALLVSGPSGIGKTSMIDRLAMKLNSLEPSPYEEGNLIFAKNQASAYWEGYTQQLVTSYDDMFQIKDVNERAKLADEIIRVCNSIPLALNMASLNSKGNVMFASKYVVATSNVEEERSLGIACPDAFWRRFNTRACFDVPTKYRGARGPNWDKMQLDYPDVPATELMYKLMECTLKFKDKANVTLSFEQFSDYVAQDAAQHFNRGFFTLEANRAYIARNAAKFKDSRIDNSTVPLNVKMTNLDTGISHIIPVSDNTQGMEAQGTGASRPSYSVEFSEIEERFGPDIDPTELDVDDIEFSSPWSHLIIDAVCSALRINGEKSTWYNRAFTRGSNYLASFVRPVHNFTNFSHLHTVMTTAEDEPQYSVLLTAIKVFTTCATLYLGYKAINGVASELNTRMWCKPTLFETQSNEFADKKYRKERGVKRIVKNGTKYVVYDDGHWDAEGSAWSDDYLKKIRTNIARVEVELDFDDSTRRDAQNILFINGGLALTTAHLVWSFIGCNRAKSFITVSTTTLRKKICLDSIKWIIPEESENIDFAMIDFGITAIQRPTIVDRFLTIADINRTRFESSVMMKYVPNGDRGSFCERDISGATLHDKSPPYCEGENEYEIESILRYNIQTSRGDCGSVVLHNDKSRTGAILGIHVAGKANTPDGFAQVISREALCAMMEAFGVNTERVKFPETIPLNSDDAEKYYAYSQLDVIGKVPPQCATSMPTKTKIKKSLVHGVFQEPTHMPAMLRKTGDISPVAVALAKANIVEGSIQNDILDECLQHMMFSYNNLRNFGYARTLSDYETVNGLKASHHMKPINIASSPGYPYILTSKGAGKSDWFKTVQDNGDDVILMTSKFRTELYDDIKLLANNKIPFYTFISCLKDEKRPIQKVKEGKTRLFSCGNMKHLLLCRKYYGGFNAFLTANKDFLASKVGIAANGPEFDEFYKYMTRGRTPHEAKHNWNDGDYGAFDDSIMARLIMAYFEIAMEWYKFHSSKEPGFEVDQLIRKNLIPTFIGPPHILGNTLYSLTKGNSSGNFATVHINGIVNELVNRYTFLFLGKGKNYTNHMFDKYVNFATYGDDSLSCIGDEVSDVYNGTTIGPVMLDHFGMTYTTASKSQDAVPLRDRDEVDFCKRKFQWRPELRKTVGVMPLSGLLETTNWIKQSVDDRDSTVANVESTHRELFLHGKEIYNHYSKIFVEGCAKAHCTYIPRSYRSLQEDFYANTL